MQLVSVIIILNIIITNDNYFIQFRLNQSMETANIFLQGKSKKPSAI